MNIITKNNKQMAVFDDKNIKIKDVQDVLDLMATARYYSDGDAIIICKESLSEEFFNLKTRFAGEVLQKFVNYNMKIAVVGDFSQYTSKSLQDFIYECNNGRHIFFKKSIEEAVGALAGKNEE
jgi:hypothetical protein